jgi:hypothetical protein
MSDDEKHWWQTLPAIIGGLAALVTALTGLLVALNREPGEETNPRKQPVTPTIATTPVKSPEGTTATAIEQKKPLTLVADIWKVELGQKSTKLATKEFSSGAGPGVPRTSLTEFAEWVSNQLHLGGGEPVPVRIGVEKFRGPDKLTERVRNELKANPLIQIVDPGMLETVPKQKSTAIDYIISGSAHP